jgi:hypothetical protein
MKNTSDSTCQKMSSRRLVPGLLLLSITLLAGCKCNQGDQNQDRIDSLARLQADSISQENRNASHQFTFDSLTTGWLSATMGGRKVDTAAFKNGRAPGSPDSSTAQGGDAATGQFPDPVNFQPDQQYYKDFASVLRFSPDSSYILDFGSYGNIPVKGKSGRTTLEGGEPDTKIMVGIPGEHKEWQVMFAGPGTAILDATWKNDHQFMVLYASQGEGNRIDTTLIMGDMQTKSLHWFQLNQ